MVPAIYRNNCDPARCMLLIDRLNTICCARPAAPALSCRTDAMLQYSAPTSTWPSTWSASFITHANAEAQCELGWMEELGWRCQPHLGGCLPRPMQQGSNRFSHSVVNGQRRVCHDTLSRAYTISWRASPKPRQVVLVSGLMRCPCCRSAGPTTGCRGEEVTTPRASHNLAPEGLQLWTLRTPTTPLSVETGGCFCVGIQHMCQRVLLCSLICEVQGAAASSAIRIPA